MKNNYTCIQTGCSLMAILQTSPQHCKLIDSSNGASCNLREQLDQLISYLWLSILLRFPKCFKRCYNIVRVDL